MEHLEMMGLPCRLILEVMPDKKHRVQIDITGETTLMGLREHQGPQELRIPLLGFELQERIVGAIDDFHYHFGF